MTSSSNRIGISAERSPFENLVATPAQPTLPEAPAQPNREQYRRGGSLYDKSSFQPNKAAEKAISQLENFLDKETGGWNNAQQYLFEQWKIGAKSRADYTRRVDNYLSSAKTAFEAGQRNADITKALEAKGELELAKENRLQDKWTNFYYFDSKAQEAGKEVAIKLQSAITDQLDHISDLPETERGLYIQTIADNLLKGYADIPQDARAARIDPFVAAISADGKVKAIARAKLKDELTDQRTFETQAKGSLSAASGIIKKAGETPESLTELIKAFTTPRDWARNIKGYSPQKITDMYSQWIQSGLFIDTDGDGYNDIGQHIDASMIMKALEGVKIGKEKLPLLDLRDSEQKSLRSLLIDAQAKAIKTVEAQENARLKRRERKLLDFKQNLTDASREWWLKHPNPTTKQLMDQRAVFFTAVNDFYEKEGGKDSKIMNQKNVSTLMAELYPDATALQKTPKILETNLLGEADRLIANGATDIPPGLMLQMRVGNDPNGALLDVYPKVLSKFYKAQSDGITQSNTDQKAFVANDIKSIKLDVKSKLGDSNAIIKRLLNADTLNVRNYGKGLLDEVSGKVNTILDRQLPGLLNEAYAAERKKGNDINDQAVQQRVLTKVTQQILASPFLSDIDSWVDPIGQNQFKIRDVPHLGEITLTDGKNPHKINISYSDGTGLTAAGYLSRTFTNKPKLYLKHLKGTFVLPEEDIKTWTKVLSHYASNTPLPEGIITDGMRERLHNMSTVASGGSVKPGQVLEATLKTYEGSNKRNQRNLTSTDYSAAFNLMGSMTHSVDATNLDEDAIDATSITARPMSRLIYGSNEYAMDFTLTKGNDQQFSNEVASPVNGQVVYVGKDKIHGNYVVIRAGSKSNFNFKGDLIKISNLAGVNAKVGDQISRGVLVGLQGDDSELNTTDRSTTGSEIDSGHINIQVLQPGDNVNPDNNSQYSQAYQNRFFRGMVLSIYNSDKEAPLEVKPVRFVNPRDLKTIIPVTTGVEALNKAKGIGIKVKGDTSLFPGAYKITSDGRIILDYKPTKVDTKDLKPGDNLPPG